MAILVPRARRWLFQDSETRSWLCKFALWGYFGDSMASYTVIMNSPIHHFDTRLSFVMIPYHAKRKAQKWKLFWSLHMKAKKIIHWRIINGTERETLRPSLWDMWISLKLFLNQLNAWINRKLVSGEIRNFCLVLSRDNSTVASTLFWLFCFETDARKLDDVPNNRLRFGDVQWIRFRLITISKNNFNEIHLSGQGVRFLCVRLFSGGLFRWWWWWWWQWWWWWLSLKEEWLDS